MRIVAFALLLLVAACAPRYVIPGPARVTPHLSNEGLVAADGTVLSLRHFESANPRAVVIAVHGFNDYANAFSSIGPWLAKSGVATYAYDQRGFGSTPVRGRWPGEKALIADLDLAVKEVRRTHPGLPVFVLGESMGGAVVLSWAAKTGVQDVSGLILVAPAVWGWHALNFAYKTVLFSAAHMLPWVALTGRQVAVWPSDNMDMLRAYSRDPKVIKKTRVDTLYGLVSLMDRGYLDAKEVHVPSLILYGDHDKVVPSAPVRHVYKSLGSQARMVCYQKGYHMLLRDLQAQTVWHDLLAFVENPQGGALPSGEERVLTGETLTSRKGCGF